MFSRCQYTTCYILCQKSKWLKNWDRARNLSIFLRDFLLPVAFKKLKGKLGKSFLVYKQSWLELEYLRESLQSLTICCLRHWESVVIPAGTDVRTVMFIVSLVSFSNYCPYIFALAILCAFPWVIWCNSSCSVFILNIAGSLQVTSYKNSLGKNNSCLSASFLIIVKKKTNRRPNFIFGIVFKYFFEGASFLRIGKREILNLSL